MVEPLPTVEEAWALIVVYPDPVNNPDKWGTELYNLSKEVTPIRVLEDATKEKALITQVIQESGYRRFDPARFLVDPTKAYYLTLDKAMRLLVMSGSPWAEWSRRQWPESASYYHAKCEKNLW